MNRVGLVVDMSHSAERSTLEAMEVSTRPIAITHANPAGWHAGGATSPTRSCARWPKPAACWGFRSIRTT
jgi:hypothetical protein